MGGVSGEEGAAQQTQSLLLERTGNIGWAGHKPQASGRGITGGGEEQG